VSEESPAGFIEAFAATFQVAYVTRDRSGAQRELSTRLGLGGWTELDVEVAGAELAVAFARAGRVVIELVQPLGGDAELFTGLLPAEGLVKLHHLGVRVDDIDLALEHADSAGYACASAGELAGQLRFAFVDTTGDLGHYIELAQFTPVGWEFIAGILQRES